jgi:serralysin
MPRPRANALSDIQPMADYLVSGYWIEEEGRQPFRLPGDAITVNLTGLDAVGRTLARGALEAWEMVTPLNFREVTRGGQIAFTDNGSSATTNLGSGNPSAGVRPVVNIGAGWLDRYGDRVGDFSFHSYIHEIGHALGLGHAGAYDGALPTWPHGMKFANDSWNLSVMSYYAQAGNHSNPNADANRAAAIGPQVADILAIQAIYGAPAANTGVTGGDTVWGVGSNLDNHLGDYFRAYYKQGVFQPAAVTFTIFDTGGNDTVDLSFHGKGQTVNLEDGGVISAFDLKANIMIMPGTVIENASTGRGDDTVWGNRADNRITANAGADTVWGQGGNDRIDGGDQDDELHGDAGADSLLGGNGNDALSGGNGNDRMDGGLHNDDLQGGGGHDSLAGDFGDDTLAGGTGDDRIDGGRGNDRMAGNGGRDVFVFGGGTDVITDFGPADRVLFDRTMDRDGTLTADDLARLADVVRGNLVIDMGGRGMLTLNGVTDAGGFLDTVGFF